MITAEIRGDREVIAHFQALPPKAHLRVVKAVTQLATRLQAYVKAGKLSGQVLHVRTGALRRSVAQKIEDTSDIVTGRIGVFGGPTVPYGRAHEFGFEGTVTVKEHFRRIVSKRRFRALQRKATGIETPGLAGATIVREHSMRMHIPEHSFLRSSLGEMRGAILQLLDQAVREAAHA